MEIDGVHGSVTARATGCRCGVHLLGLGVLPAEPAGPLHGSGGEDAVHGEDEGLPWEVEALTLVRPCPRSWHGPQ